MEKDQIKIAFLKVKQDIFSLEKEISKIILDLDEIKNSLKEFHLFFKAFNIPTDSQTIQQINPTFDRYSTDNPTLPQEIKGLKSPFLSTSTGNKGVPTDRQTDQQINQQTQDTLFLKENDNKSPTIVTNIKEASEILDSLDRLKKEIRSKFKHLTTQEMLVFSTVYQLEDKNPQNTTYKDIALILKLSESSIRDYIQKIIKKGISIDKTKINNKKVLLSISPELKKFTNLQTILQLREL